MARGEDRPDEVHGGGREGTAAYAEEERERDAKDVLGAVAEGGEVVRGGKPYRCAWVDALRLRERVGEENVVGRGFVGDEDRGEGSDLRDGGEGVGVRVAERV